MTTKQPLISIVLPVYNGEQDLAQAIQSVLDQTYPHWELLIVDDASSDNTPQIAQRYAETDTRIRYLRHTQNKKLPAALNTGFRAAQGTFFTWTSDDNLYRPHALETLLEFLLQHPQVDVVYSDYTALYEEQNVSRRITVQPPRFLVRKSVVGACFLHRREVYDVLGGYDEQLFLVEDYDFWLRASQRFHLAPLHEDLYLYRFHSGALTAQHRLEIMQRREEILVRHLPNLPWANRVDLARGYLHLGEVARELGSWQRAIGYHITALRHHPLVTIRYYVLRLLPKRLRYGVGVLYRRYFLHDESSVLST